MKRNKRYYSHYTLWEDYKHGMYDLTKEYNEKETEKMANDAKQLLSDSKMFYRIGKKMLDEWKIAAKVNLTNKNRNRQAWIGQATCCYSLALPERITKIGWRLMMPTEQKEANKVADNLIFEWENHGQEKIK